VCNRVRDEIQAGITLPDSALSAEALSHVRSCRSCGDFHEAISLIDRLGTTWQASDPPQGLAQSTMAFLEPHWPRKERPVSRQERRLIWSSGVAMAGAAAVVLLILADRLFPVAQGTQIDHLIETGLKMGAVQVLAGSILSLVFLVIRAARSSDSEPRRRSGRDRGGRE
jgi:hypothetical protein